MPPVQEGPAEEEDAIIERLPSAPQSPTAMLAQGASLEGSRSRVVQGVSLGRLQSRWLGEQGPASRRPEAPSAGPSHGLVRGLKPSAIERERERERDRENP